MLTVYPKSRKTQGFSLVEIMVGMVIGLLGMLVIMQVYTTSEARKKSTTSGGDAQSNGAIGMFNLQREIQLSGYGISSASMLGCNVQLRAGVSINNISPVTINHPSIPAGDANTDTLLVVYGNANYGAEGDTIIGNTTPTLLTVKNPSSFMTADNVVAQLPTRAIPCNLTLDTIANDPVADQQVILSNGITGATQGLLFNLGQSPKIRAYAIRNANLTACDYTVNDCSNATNANNTNIWVPLTNNIVSLRAEYGRDTNSASMDGVVDTYDQVVATTTTTPAVASVQCGWFRVSAIRMVLVARSAQKEVSAVTTAAPTWAGSASYPVSLSSNTDWQKYRYKKFETVVPLKNIAWQETVSGC